MMEISSLLTGLAAIGKFGSDMASASDTAKRQALLVEFQKGLIDAYGVATSLQVAQLSLAQRNRDLEEQIVNFEDWKTKATQYSLKAVGAHKNVFVYAYTPTVQTADPRHWICANCFENRKRSILHAVTSERAYKCDLCQSVLKPMVVGGGVSTIESAYD